MVKPTPVKFRSENLDAAAKFKGSVAVAVPPNGKLDRIGSRLDQLSMGALKRLVKSPEWAKAKSGSVISLARPAGLAASSLDVLCLPANADSETTRKGGAALGKRKGKGGAILFADQAKRPVDLVLGAVLRDYAFFDRRSKEPEEGAPNSGGFVVMARNHARLAADAKPDLAAAQGVFLARDLVNEPANHLTTTEFAKRIRQLSRLGVKVTILREDRLRKLGMNLLLSVGQGSESPSIVAVMEWNGGKRGAAPLALVGKGVVFDTGGISLKPAGGMEEMTMDMGGAAVVTGAMHALAARKASVNAVGLVGLVENMPSGSATRPGDVVASMKGDTVEIINTDAEGRLVLADLLWYAKTRFKPRGIVDLATLTGAIIIGLGHHRAGAFSNSDRFVKSFLKAAEAQGEKAWHMPLDKAYDDSLKSWIADVRNVGDRAAGAVTAARFLARFVPDEIPWIHLDIAGVTRSGKDLPLSPKGATGWGVMSLCSFAEGLGASDG